MAIKNLVRGGGGLIWVALGVGFCLLALSSAAGTSKTSPFRGNNEEYSRSSEKDVCESTCEKRQNEEIQVLRDNVTQLFESLRDYRKLFADHTDHHQYHQQQYHHAGSSQLGQYPGTGNNPNLVDTLVTGVQKPIIGVTQTLSSDYFPFPENHHRPAEHHAPDASGRYDQHSSQSGGQGRGQGSMDHHHGGQDHHAGQQTGCDGARSHPAAFMRPPRVRQPEDFDFAACHVRPNTAASSDKSNQVHGIVILWQKKNSPTLYMTLRIAGFNHTSGHGHHDDHHSEDVHEISQKPQKPVERYVQPGSGGGASKFNPYSQQKTTSQQVVDIGHSHGFHVHERGDLSEGCESAGAHYNPYKIRHGGPKSLIRHVGDFGNIDCDDDGNTNLIVSDEVASLRGQYSIIGKSLVIHANYDDLGVNVGDQGSTTTGNAGGRLACCIIERVPSSLYNEGDWARGQHSDNIQQGANQHHGQHVEHGEHQNEHDSEQHYGQIVQKRQ